MSHTPTVVAATGISLSLSLSLDTPNLHSVLFNFHNAKISLIQLDKLYSDTNWK